MRVRVLLNLTLSHYTLWIVNVKSHCYFLFFRYFAGMLRYTEIDLRVVTYVSLRLVRPDKKGFKYWDEFDSECVVAP
jgi:hypothetical protein